MHTDGWVDDRIRNETDHNPYFIPTHAQLSMARYWFTRAQHIRSAGEGDSQHEILVSCNSHDNYFAIRCGLQNARSQEIHRSVRLSFGGCKKDELLTTVNIYCFNIFYSEVFDVKSIQCYAVL